MKILTIGPEGAGKTVFLTMLTSYMSGKSCPLPIHVETFAAAEKIEGFKRILKNGEWPDRNLEAEPHEIFTFCLGSPKGRKIHLWDFPGERFRKNTINPAEPDPAGHLKRLRETIEEAHMLIYLLDLSELITADASTKKATEDAWLFKEFLTNSKWKNRQRLVVVTKADLYRGLIDKADGDLRKMIIDAWPEGIIACPLNADAFPKVDFFAVTSVTVKNVIGDDRIPRPMPKSPLESEGFEPLVKRILEGLSGGLVTKIKNTLLFGRRGLSSGSARIADLISSLPKKAKLLIVFVVLTLLSLGFHLLATDRYELKFVTGDSPGVGTDSPVTISLTGNDDRVVHATLGKLHERQDMQNLFERGETNIFEQRMRPLGEIKVISIKITDTGDKPAWFLKSVHVTNINTGMVNTFSCSRWLGRDSSNPGNDPWEVTLTSDDSRM
jgi:hypothetical protein